MRKRNVVLEQNDDFVVIELTQNQKTIIDAEDYDKIKDIKWFACKDKRSNDFYCRGTIYRNSKRTTINLSRFLMDVNNSNLVVDHINHDTLNNRKYNLRICTQKENSWNSKKCKNKKTSRFTGVTFNKLTKKFRARIKVNDEEIYLGVFDSEENAAHAYNEASKKYFGEFSCLNKKLGPKIKEHITVPKDNTSGYRGVDFLKNNKKYRARFNSIHLGTFDRPIDAAKAYNEAAIKYHGEKAKLNKIPSD